MRVARFALLLCTGAVAALLAAADPPRAAPAPVSAPPPASAPASGAPPPAPAAAWGGVAAQEAALSRAVFLLRRDACLLVEADAPQVASWDTDASGALVPMKTQVPRCDASAPLATLLHAGAAALALAHDKQPPASVAGPFSLDRIDAAFVALVGRPLSRAREPTAIENETLQSYDAAAIEAAFRALYVKPGESRLGVPLRALYDATIKDALGAQLRDLELIAKNKKALAAEAKKLNDGARKGTGASGKDAWRAALNRLVTSDEAAATIDPRLVGFALRRQADGTLDTIVACLRTVRSDYEGAATTATPR